MFLGRNCTLQETFPGAYLGSYPDFLYWRGITFLGDDSAVNKFLIWILTEEQSLRLAT